jgi:hypothetical protein
MRYLGLALYAEGPTDYRFLPPILRRLADELCLQAAEEVVEVSDVLPLDAPEAYKDHGRATRILEAARAAWGAFSILFVHTDGGGDPEAAFRARIEPAAQAVAQQLGGGENCAVAVVPVRETEAWALADGAALRGAFGTTLDDAALGLPGHPHEVERLPDPKQTLRAAFAQVLGRRRGKRKVSHHLEAISQRVGLDRLRQVPAFARFEAELSSALVALGFLKRGIP